MMRQSVHFLGSSSGRTRTSILVIPKVKLLKIDKFSSGMDLFT